VAQQEQQNVGKVVEKFLLVCFAALHLHSLLCAALGSKAGISLNTLCVYNIPE